VERERGTGLGSEGKTGLGPVIIAGVRTNQFPTLGEFEPEIG